MKKLFVLINLLGVFTVNTIAQQHIVVTQDNDTITGRVVEVNRFDNITIQADSLIKINTNKVKYIYDKENKNYIYITENNFFTYLKLHTTISTDINQLAYGTLNMSAEKTTNNELLGFKLSLYKNIAFTYRASAKYNRIQRYFTVDNINYNTIKSTTNYGVGLDVKLYLEHSGTVKFYVATFFEYGEIKEKMHRWYSAYYTYYRLDDVVLFRKYGYTGINFGMTICTRPRVIINPELSLFTDVYYTEAPFITSYVSLKIGYSIKNW